MKSIRNGVIELLVEGRLEVDELIVEVANRRRMVFEQGILFQKQVAQRRDLCVFIGLLSNVIVNVVIELLQLRILFE